MVSLLDVNVLVALLDSAHEHHDRVRRWFQRQHADGWATCPIVENGLIRVISSLSYPNLRVSAFEAANSLRTLRERFGRTYTFWADDISLPDVEIFDLRVLIGSRQTTDAYLAGLAFRKSGRLASLDTGISWKAVRGADARLIDRVDA